MVFTPIWDHNPFKWPTTPYVMWLLVVINFAVFFVQAGGGQAEIDQADRFAGLVPAAFSGGAVPGALAAPLTLITSMFLHANFWHVFGNMLYFFVFGDDIEEVLGHWRFLGFYLACGVIAGLAFVLSDPHSTTELIGASGAVAGVISAYLLFRPCAKVTCLLGIIPLRLRAYWILGRLGHRAGPGGLGRHSDRRRLLGAFRRPGQRRGPVRGDAPGRCAAVRLRAARYDAADRRHRPATLTVCRRGH